jgi:hypothetical protein
MGKSTVGITKQDKERRWLKCAGYEHQPKFYKAIQEYGWRNILHEVIAENLTEQEARQMEKYKHSLHRGRKKRMGRISQKL